MIKSLLRKIFRRYIKKSKKVNDPDRVTYWIDRILGNDSNFIVQIGSNDGKTGDPLFELFKKNKRWEGLFVEPIPYLFDELKRNYQFQSRFIFENAAISDNKALYFYWVSPEAKETNPDLPFWYDQLGSFDRKHIEKHLDGKLIPFIQKTKVDVKTLSELFEEHHISKIDLLHIDVEGHDWKVLSQLDLQQFKPKVILFEYHHLDENELKAAREFLQNHYYMYIVGIDMFCILRQESLVTQLSQKFREVSEKE